MIFEHACFISFPRGEGKDTQFAEEFYVEFLAQLHVYNKKLSVFKFDRCEDRRKGDAWELWIQKELCNSAMMIAVCAPNYFNGSPGCVNEFRGMEQLITDRCRAIGDDTCKDWLLGLRLKDKVPMPDLNPYSVIDFLDCCRNPKRLRQLDKHLKTVESLADRVYRHWEWVNDEDHQNALQIANICSRFKLPSAEPMAADPFPHTGAVR